MQVSGKILVLSTFAIGLAMAGGAWWYNFQQTRQMAQFWGARDAALLVGAEKVELLTLDDPAAEGAHDVAGRKVSAEFDLTGKPGLVHLRHALTFDDNFQWDKSRKLTDSDDPSWVYAIRFTRGDGVLAVFFTRDFAELGRLNVDGKAVEILPCPRLGPVLVDYLGKKDVGALTPDAK